MNELISVVLPTYNRAQTLMRSINSVLCQTYSKLELIIVDDGSEDCTSELVQTIRDKRVRYIKQENQGACVARNRGIAEAKGYLIAFQDSDDEWYPTKLEKQMEYLNVTNADIVFHSFFRRGLVEDGEYIPDSHIPSKQVFLDDIVPVNMISTQTILGKRSCFMDEPFNAEYKRFQDWELGLRLVKRFRVFYDSNVLANVYVSDDSISKKPELALHSIFGIFHNTVGAYREIIQEKDRRVDELEVLLQESTHALVSEQLLADEYRKQIDEYRLSKSWKATAPLRELSKMIRGAFLYRE